MKDIFLITGSLGACLGLAVLVFLVIDHVKARRPYLAARWDDGAGDWADERSDMSLADLDLCNRLWDLPAHDRAEAAITRGLADLFEQLGPPPANEDDDHTTNPTGDQ